MPSAKDRHPEEARSAVSKDALDLVRRPCVLADLLKDMTPEAMHDAFDWGPDQGCEVIDD